MSSVVKSNIFLSKRAMLLMCNKITRSSKGLRENVIVTKKNLTPSTVSVIIVSVFPLPLFVHSYVPASSRWTLNKDKRLKLSCVVVIFRRDANCEFICLPLYNVAEDCGDDDLLSHNIAEFNPNVSHWMLTGSVILATTCDQSPSTTTCEQRNFDDQQIPVSVHLSNQLK